MPSSNKKTTPAKPKYGAGWGEEEFFDLETPTGVMCQVRKPSPQRLAFIGALDNFNQLSKLIKVKVDRVKGKPGAAPSAKDVDASALASDPSKLRDIMNMADKIVEYVVVQPVIKRPVKSVGTDSQGKPIEEALMAVERTPGVIYTDMIDEMDRMFIMQYAMGVKPDLAAFRVEFGGVDSDLGNVDEVADSTE